MKRTATHTELEGWEFGLFLLVVMIYGFVFGVLFCRYS